MKAIILAGGKGLRLRQIIEDIPKPMADIGGKPFLEYLVLFLKKWGITDIIIAVGFKKEAIKPYFATGKKWGVNITYSVEREPLGTAGALKRAIIGTSGKQFIVLNGDSFLDIDFNKLIYFHKQKKSLVTLSLLKVKDAARYGRVKINSSSQIIEFSEKCRKGKGLINGGVYLMERDVVKFIPEGNVSLENQVLPLITGRGLYGLLTDGFFVDIGLPEDYFKLSCSPKQIISVVS